jgi:hypothetical protein
MKRSILQFICVVCLLFAQQGAFTHAIWHAHGPSAQQHDSQHKPSADGDLCKLHGLFTQVVGTAPGTTVYVASEDALTEHSVDDPQLSRTTKPLTPRSRGPPRLS